MPEKEVLIRTDRHEAAASTETIVGVFRRRRDAEACLRVLLREGFTPAQVGFAGPGVAAAPLFEAAEPSHDGPLAAAATGSLAGGVVGGVLGAVVAILIPGVGPIVAGGVLAGIVTGAPTGAALGGVAGALAEAGLPFHLADFYEGQVRAGSFLVTVGGDHPAEAREIVARVGGAVEGRLSRSVSEATGTTPETPEVIEGEFRSQAAALLAAVRLREAFPEEEVSVETRDRRVVAEARRERD